MHKNMNFVLQSISAAALAMAVVAGAQAPASSDSQTQNDIKDLKARIAQLEAAQKAAAPAAPAAAPTWSVGPMDISGFIDGYYSYNFNRPNQDSDTGQYNQLYNFNDVTDQFALSAAKLTLNHDPDPVGAHIDFLYGRTDTEINGSTEGYYGYAQNDGAGKYIEQAYLSLKPTKAKGFEADFGKFVTSAGAEVIESKDNWNYSRSLLFSHAIPYNHLGLRTSMPVSKTETIGLQVVNNIQVGDTGYCEDVDVQANCKVNSGVSFGLTSAYVKPKYTWNANYYFGPQNYNTQKGYLNLFDTTLLLTPTAKFNAYINYDYGQDRNADYNFPYHTGQGYLAHWQGVAIAAHEQFAAKDAFAVRYEYYFDPQGFTAGIATEDYYRNDSYRGQMQEVTFTYEHKWVEGLLARIEYRHDWTNFDYFAKGYDEPTVKAQSTLTAGFVAFFGPKR